MTRIPSFHSPPTRGGVTTGIPGGAWMNPGSPWAKNYVHGGHREFVDRTRDFTVGGSQIPGSVLYPYPAPLASIMTALWRASSWTVTASCAIEATGDYGSVSGAVSFDSGVYTANVTGTLDADEELMFEGVSMDSSGSHTESSTFSHGRYGFSIIEDDDGATVSRTTLTQPDIDQRLSGQWISSEGGTGVSWFSGPRMSFSASFSSATIGPPVSGLAGVGFSFDFGFSSAGEIPSPLAHVPGGSWYLPLDFRGALSASAQATSNPWEERFVAASSAISAWPPTVTGWSEVESPTDNLVVTIDGITIMDTPLYVWGMTDSTWDLSIRLDGTV